MAANQTEFSRPEQRAVMGFLIAEKCKPSEIYQRMCDVQMFTNRLSMGLPLRAWVKKTVYGMETERLSSKEKILSAVVSKEDHADNVLGYERIHHYWFSWKRCNYKQYFLLPTS